MALRARPREARRALGRRAGHVTFYDRQPMLYMVVETFTEPRAVYARARERGRMLPPGLRYVDSWIDAQGLDRCFQLMETDDPALFETWTAEWSDLGEFEIIPVVGSAEAAARAVGEAGR
jgi:hypothetical protein